jgi:hypothetical protein
MDVLVIDRSGTASLSCDRSRLRRFLARTTSGRGSGTDLFNDLHGRDASDQAVAVSMNLSQKLLAEDVNRRETRQVEHNSLMRLPERRRRPVSRQFVDSRAGEAPVEAKRDHRHVGLYSNHEHG